MKSRYFKCGKNFGYCRRNLLYIKNYLVLKLGHPTPTLCLNKLIIVKLKPIHYSDFIISCNSKVSVLRDMHGSHFFEWTLHSRKHIRPFNFALKSRIKCLEATFHFREDFRQKTRIPLLESILLYRCYWEFDATGWHNKENLAYIKIEKYLEQHTLKKILYSARFSIRPWTTWVDKWWSRRVRWLMQSFQFHELNHTKSLRNPIRLWSLWKVIIKITPLVTSERITFFPTGELQLTSDSNSDILHWFQDDKHAKTLAGSDIPLKL